MASDFELELALISAHIYRKNDRVGEENSVRGWTVVNQGQLGDALLGTTNNHAIPFSDRWGEGFYANAYRNPNSSEIVVDNRGIDSTKASAASVSGTGNWRQGRAGACHVPTPANAVVP